MITKILDWSKPWCLLLRINSNREGIGLLPILHTLNIFTC